MNTFIGMSLQLFCWSFCCGNDPQTSWKWAVAKAQAQESQSAVTGTPIARVTVIVPVSVTARRVLVGTENDWTDCKLVDGKWTLDVSHLKPGVRYWADVKMYIDDSTYYADRIQFTTTDVIRENFSAPVLTSGC